jgi:mono/diheme cytochrome c family protein
LIGPDLKGVTSRREQSWLVRWITEPRKMLAEGDPIAEQLWREHGDFPMPNYGLSEAQVKDIIAYLAAESGDEPPIDEVTSEVKPTPEVKPTAPTGIFEVGRALFMGQQSFANGAPACIACHSTSDVGGLGGGSLGPDLTKAHSKFKGMITPTLINTSFPTMKGVFSKKTIIDAEVAHLKAYFAETDRLEPKPAMDFTISLISIIGFIVLYILTHLIWRKRLTGVRKPLVGR